MVHKLAVSASFFVHSNPKSEFDFQMKGTMLEVDVEAFDVYFNFMSTSTKLMKGKVTSRSGRE